MTIVLTVDIDYTKSVVDNMELITSKVWSVVDTVNSDHTLSVADTVDIDYIASVDGMADIDYTRICRCQCHALQGL